MNTQHQLRQDYQHTLAHDRFGMSVAARLSDAADALPNDISERLRVARTQAVVKRKMVTAPSKAARAASVVVANGSSATLGDGDDDFGGAGIQGVLDKAPPITLPERVQLLD